MPKTHGKSGSPEHISWKSLKSRCLNKNNESYHLYGGRGITVCNRWINSFENFYADMGKRPTLKHSIDRVNNDGNYDPLNCRWADHIEQANNKHSNHFLTFKGETKTIAQWGRKFNISEQAIQRRLSRLNWTIEKTLLTPIKTKYRHTSKKLL